MLEIELKYRLTDRLAFETRLQELGARKLGSQDETDWYFNAPDRDFKVTDEVFRLRSVHGGSVLTYKGPKKSGTVKTREEIELPLQDGSTALAQRLIESLGYRPTATVRKHRAIYSLSRNDFEIHICLDTLENSGEYVEIEIVTDHENVRIAEAVVHAVANELDLKIPEPRAYLRIVLEAMGSEK